MQSPPCCAWRIQACRSYRPCACPPARSLRGAGRMGGTAGGGTASASSLEEAAMPATGLPVLPSAPVPKPASKPAVPASTRQCHLLLAPVRSATVCISPCLLTRGSLAVAAGCLGLGPTLLAPRPAALLLILILFLNQADERLAAPRQLLHAVGWVEVGGCERSGAPGLAAALAGCRCLVGLASRCKQRPAAAGSATWQLPGQFQPAQLAGAGARDSAHPHNLPTRPAPAACGS